MESGWFVTSGFAPGDRAVMDGAQLLLSEEMKSQIQVGEESGNLVEMLLKIAHFFDREVEHSVRRLTTLMEPVLTLVLGGIVGSIVVSLYMPIFTLAAVIRR